ncbi:MAG: transposase [Gammaproteobacteria bacterium RIFCSPHIGHO2_12_FULL_45_9]|nr:MAG: transposase [Gammaproteobacteria bacterium RIFCSPHIGHO2_12_FULL_45_9]
MLMGIRFKANPTAHQRRVLSQWMGCARLIWNAKCDEERYYTTFARKYYPIGTYAPIDQTTAQFKSPELTPWLSLCPSQILRNSAVNWHQTFQKFMKGQCGKPKRKSKSDQGSIHVTRELFCFEKGRDGVTRLFIGSKRNNIGYLSFKKHRAFQLPHSLYIKKERGRYTLSFCYDNGQDARDLKTGQEHLAYLHGATREYLERYTIGIDRGVVIPAQAGDQAFDLTPAQKQHKARAERYIKRLQKRLSRQQKGSSHRRKTKYRIAAYHAKSTHIRRDFCHQTSRKLINSTPKIFIFEDLRTAYMTRHPKPQQDPQNNFIPNKAAQKAGLNRAILDKGWHQLETFTEYKAYQAGKAVFKVSANHTSQECADCGHIHPDNRKSQALFQCGRCGHTDNADRNASLIIKKRAIHFILDTGSVLSERGVLSSSGTGRGVMSKTDKGKPLSASDREASKKKRVRLPVKAA